MGPFLAKRVTGLVIRLETLMYKTSYRYEKNHAKWQPDGLAYDPLTRQLYLLELTRWNNSGQSNLLDALERKAIKYNVFCEALC